MNLSTVNWITFHSLATYVFGAGCQCVSVWGRSPQSPQRHLFDISRVFVFRRERRWEGRPRAHMWCKTLPRLHPRSGLVKSLFKTGNTDLLLVHLSLMGGQWNIANENTSRGGNRSSIQGVCIRDTRRVTNYLTCTMGTPVEGPGFILGHSRKNLARFFSP